MANTPAAATIRKVQDQLGATPRPVSAIANAAGLSPATARKCLKVLAERGAAVRNPETGDWLVMVNSETLAEPAKQAPAKSSAKKQSTPEDVPSPLAGLAATLSRWGWSDTLARRDAEVYEIIEAHGPVTEEDIAKRVANLSGWSLRRLLSGEHRGQICGDPLITSDGKGKDRTYQVVGK